MSTYKSEAFLWVQFAAAAIASHDSFDDVISVSEQAAKIADETSLRFLERFEYGYFGPGGEPAWKPKGKL